MQSIVSQVQDIVAQADLSDFDAISDVLVIMQKAVANEAARRVCAERAPMSEEIFAVAASNLWSAALTVCASLIKP